VTFPNEAGQRLLESPPLWLTALHLTIHGLATYAVFFSIVRFVILLVFLHRFFRSFSIRVNPLHIDGCGGFGILGRVVTVSLLFATLLGITAVVMAVASVHVGMDPWKHPETILVGVSYLVLPPLLWVSLIWSPHRAMLEDRDAILQPLGDAFQRVIAHEVQALDAATLRAGNEELAELLRRQSLLRDAFPTWPIQLGRLRSLMVTVVVPLLLSVVPVIIKSYGK
jgi:hypothetical protein